VRGTGYKVAGCQAAADFVAEREGKLHILINNAGATWGGHFDDYPDSAWARVRGRGLLVHRLAETLLSHALMRAA
jgi:NAD(P)-dependent dehydrogenase (short-subunit alcohol dehydrogenase family)